MIANAELRMAIMQAGVKHYEVAAQLGINEFNFSRMLRFELDDAKKRKVLAAIEAVSKK